MLAPSRSSTKILNTTGKAVKILTGTQDLAGATTCLLSKWAAPALANEAPGAAIPRTVFVACQAVLVATFFFILSHYRVDLSHHSADHQIIQSDVMLWIRKEEKPQCARSSATPGAFRTFWDVSGN